MLEVDSLTKRFGATLAVDGLSFKAEPGRVLGFLGPNGAGKTTTLRTLLGLTLPTSGSATVDGRSYRELQDPVKVLGAVLEGPQFHPGRGAARRPARPRSRRARERPRPAGHPLAARLPARARRRGPHCADLEPRAGRGGADGRRGGRGQPREADRAGDGRGADRGDRRDGVGAEPRARQAPRGAAGQGRGRRAGAGGLALGDRVDARGGGRHRGRARRSGPRAVPPGAVARGRLPRAHPGDGGGAVIRVVSAELLKLRTTRTFYGLAGAALGVGMLIVVLVLALSDDPFDESDVRSLLSTAGGAGLLVMILGVVASAGEYRHGTIAWTLLVSPVRLLVAAGQALACALAGGGAAGGGG